MKLKNQFLRLFALLGLSMATTTAWGADETVNPTVNIINGVYSVNMPGPLDHTGKPIATWQVPNGVKAFKVYDDGGSDGAFSTTYCNTEVCAEILMLVPQKGYFLHLSGSLVSAQYQTEGKGEKVYFTVYDASTGKTLINPNGIGNDLSAWTSPDHDMLLQFYTTKWLTSGDNQAGLDLTVEVALDIGTNGLGAYSLTDGEDHIEMHASETNSKVNKKTILTSPAGTMMYVTFDATLANGDTVVVLNGGATSTDTLFKKTNATSNDIVYIPNNEATICVNTNNDGLNNILRAVANVVTKNTQLSTTGIDIYNPTANYTIAKVNDVQSGSVSISDITVNAVELEREFSMNTPATIVLPFQLPSGAKTNADFYKLNAVVQKGHSWHAKVQKISSLPKANAPYVVVIPNDTKLKFWDYSELTLQTGTLIKREVSDNNWYFIGTYTKMDWDNNDALALAYGFAANNEPEICAGAFGRLGSGSSVAPMRAYLSKASPDVVLSRPLAQGEVSSIESLPEVIDVEFIDEEEKTTAIGRMNTVTGAIKIDRWFDLKGRSTNHKPTTKGAFFNQKGIAK